MNWPSASLGEISESVDYGLTASAVDQPIGPKFLRITDIQGDSVDWEFVPYCTADAGKLLRTRLVDGDIVFARTGATTGKSFLVRNPPDDAVFASYLIRVRPSERLDSTYLAHYFRTPAYWRQVEKAARGAAQPGINASVLKSLVIPLPPVKEQCRIAAILDKADTLRRKRLQALSLANDLLKSAFLEMFGSPIGNPRGWEVGVIGNCLKGVVGGWSAKADSRPANNAEIGVLKISAVTSGEYLPSENKAVLSIPTGKKLIIPQVGDLLFSRANTRELVAATCIVLEAPQNVFLPDKLWRLDVDRSVAEATYLKFVLAHPEYRRLLCSRATGTSGSMLNISKAKLTEHSIPIPPLGLQKDFSSLWRSVHTINTKLRSEVMEADSLFYSLSQRAFRGKLQGAA